MNQTPLQHSLYQSCLRWLAMREHSQQELRSKLLAKGFAVADIEPVLTQLAEQDYQSDARYAEQYARSRINKGYGALFIRHALQKKGMTESHIRLALTASSEDALAVLTKVYQKKYGDSPCLSLQELAKRQRFLKQRGFDYALIQQFFKKLSE